MESSLRPAAGKQAERDRAGLAIFTDGSRLNSRAAGYAVAWKSKGRWASIKTHMGYNQEAYDAECAALARALEMAGQRQTVPEKVAIFTDAQAAIRRMASEDPGPGQQSIQARKRIAKLGTERPNTCIEIRWCPAHSGVEGTEKADERARQAADEPDVRGVEWLGYGDRCGGRRMPLSRSLARNFRRKRGTGRRKESTGASTEGGNPTAGRSGGPGIKATGRAVPSAQNGALSYWATRRHAGDVGTRHRHGSTYSRTANDGRHSRKFCGRRCGEIPEKGTTVQDPRPTRGRGPNQGRGRGRGAQE